MTKWKKITLEECCHSITDGDHQSMPVSECGVPFIIISNIKNNRIDFEDTRFVPVEYYDSLDVTRKAQRGDILYTVKGSFGIPAYVDSDMPFVFQRDIAILKCNNRVNSKFLYYIMKSVEFERLADLLAIGSAQRAITLKTLRGIEILIPEKSEQDRIVEMLSPYDDLIENNQKQIKLLEEAAQRLYKEWFVDLRFPGYEDVQIVDGVPAGWHKGTVQEIVKYHDTMRKPLSGQQREKMKGKYRYYGAAGVLDYVNKYIFDGTYLLLGEDGTVITNDGLPVLQYVTGQFWVNNHAHVLTGKGNYSTEFIYMMFSFMGISDVVTGVAQPKISQGRLSAKKVVIPSEGLAVLFHNNTKPIFDRVLLLEKQITLFSEARDRLLPKLMSGEIEL